MHQYQHVLRRDGDKLRRALDFEVDGKRERPKITRKTQVEEIIAQMGVKKEDATAEIK